MNKIIYTLAITFGISCCQQTFATKNKINEHPHVKKIENTIDKNRQIYKNLAAEPKNFNTQLKKDFTYQEMKTLEYISIKWILKDPIKSKSLAQKMIDEWKSLLTAKDHYESINKIVRELEIKYYQTDNSDPIKNELERKIIDIMPVLFMAEQKYKNHYIPMSNKEIQDIKNLTIKTFQEKNHKKRRI